mmetsp:Transcript_9957/g.21901  ORF Transcript_9957/g.21901 Transcript_9957/m.21901 type:complete len:88 (-) Transcript_9957:98-361(-)
MVCPIRLLVTIAACLGLAAYLGPLALEASGLEGQRVAAKSKLRLSHRVGLWLATLVIVGLHADLLLSLGYTKCAFNYVAGLHRLMVS